MLLLVIILILLFGGFGAFHAWGPMGGGISIGTILLIVLVLYLLGVLSDDG
jgi:hypothetical protein